MAYPEQRRDLSLYRNWFEMPTAFVMKGQCSPDTRIRVSNQEFQVHSAVLSFHSKYFQDLLDSPEKEFSAAFRYDYDMVRDPDGESRFEPAAMVPPKDTTKDGELLNPQWCCEDEEKAFGIILCTMYGIPYCIRDAQALALLTKLAELYDVIPIVSGSVNGALWFSTDLTWP
ncbi:hypothetical protein PVAG01_02065 [Phlyctema vagabunda]|uniref:BTB domain-containing protein n=1 Tax=Phlyctema vagabunda TaxID=108571 RepID=A0ABR4PPQ5_9HELO